MTSNIALNDTSPGIGQPRLVINQPLPEPGVSGFLPLATAYQDLFAYVVTLEERIQVLESRTWWSMLKAQIRSWFK